MSFCQRGVMYFKMQIYFCHNHNNINVVYFKIPCHVPEPRVKMGLKNGNHKQQLASRGQQYSNSVPPLMRTQREQFTDISEF